MKQIHLENATSCSHVLVLPTRGTPTPPPPRTQNVTTNSSPPSRDFKTLSAIVRHRRQWDPVLSGGHNRTGSSTMISHVCQKNHLLPDVTSSLHCYYPPTRCYWECLAQVAAHGAYRLWKFRH